MAFDLTNEGNDSGQLHPMAMQDKETLQVEQVTVVADSGYSNGEQGQQCEDKVEIESIGDLRIRVKQELPATGPQG